MSRLISYAQNFEDVILWRALGDVGPGTYVDVGAQDPLVDSVSLAFYERGWRGVHVEPSPQYAAALRHARPDEKVVQAAVASKPGSLRFYEIPQSGLSSGDADIAERHRAAGLEVRETDVPTCTLDEVFRHIGDKPVHWMKIDVEGMELDVLKSWSHAARPWVVLIESTEPNSPVQSHGAWEAEILGKGYDFVYFDGLNRFYVSRERPELKPFFGHGPNVFDDFALNGTAQAPFCAMVNERATAFQERARAAAEAARAGEERARAAEETARASEERATVAQVTLQARLSEARGDLINVREALRDVESRNAALALALDQWKQELAIVTASRSWKITRPLRAFNWLAARAVLGVKRALSAIIYRAWRTLRETRAAAPLRIFIAKVPLLRGRLERIVTRELSLEPRWVRAEILGLDMMDSSRHAASTFAGDLSASEILARVERELQGIESHKSRRDVH